MQPQSPVGQPPQGNKEVKEEALNAKFSYSFTRRECIILVSIIRGVQMQLGDIRAKVLVNILDELERTAIQSVTESDYVIPPKQPVPQAFENAPSTAAPDTNSQVKV